MEPRSPARTISGAMSLHGDYVWLNSDDPSTASSLNNSMFSVGGDARVDVPFSGRISMQFDLMGRYGFADDVDNSSSEDFTTGVGGGVRLNYREANKYLFGAFGGVGRVYSGTTETDENAGNLWMLGVEGQYHHGNWTLYGQAGYLDSEPLDAGGANTSNEFLSYALFLRGVTRYYFNGGNTKVEGELGYAFGTQDANSVTPDDLAVFSWGAEIEHAFHSYGDDGFVSGFLRY